MSVLPSKERRQCYLVHSLIQSDFEGVPICWREMLHTLQNCQKRTSVKGGKGDKKDAVDPFPTG